MSGHKCPILDGMKGSEFVRRVQRYAKSKGIPCAWRPAMGKGSHGTLTLGDRRTIVRDPRSELKTGTYHSMLKQLGLADRDLF